MLGKRSLLALAVLVPAVPAFAQGGGADTWQGKIDKKHQVVIVRPDGSKSTSATMTYTCDGQELYAELHGNSKGTKISFTGPAYDATGTASVKATLGKKKAHGKFKINYSKTCKLTKHFSVPYSHVTGG